MCTTPYCAGECEDCKREKENSDKYEANMNECPFKPECIVKPITSKVDRCLTCGHEWHYD